MKTSAFKINMENPCSQNLAGMDKNELGLFCTHCDKHVIDFSRMSDEEIIRVVQKTSGSFCGRFSPRQLNRALTAGQEKTTSPHLKKIMAGLFALGLLESADMNAEPVIGEKTFLSAPAEKGKQEASSFVADETIGDTTKNVLRGLLLDINTTLPVPYADISIAGTSITIRSDSAGKFMLIVPDSLPKDSFELRISAAAHYSEKPIIIKKQDLDGTQKTFLLAEEMLIEGGARMEIIPQQKREKKRKQ